MGTSFDLNVPESTIGIIPRAARHLFQGIQDRKEKAESEGKPLPDIKVTAQFLEVCVMLKGIKLKFSCIIYILISRSTPFFCTFKLFFYK